MRVEHSSVEFVKEENILKKIELAGRTCYNSQNLITEDSYKKFVKKIIERGHTSVIEHSNIIIKYYQTYEIEDVEFVYEWLLARKGATNAHVWITFEEEDGNYFIMMSGNARAWVDFLQQNVDEHLLDSDDHIKNIYLQFHEKYPELFPEDRGKPWTDTEVVFLTEKEAADINIVHTSYTFKVVTSRDITHQIVRHRTLSFSQQSQRYINFSLDKNGGEIGYIEPRIDKNSQAYEDWFDECQDIENLYNGFIDDGLVPEVARCILPNCAETIIYVTGHYLDWQHFIDLRADSHAQEEIQQIAKKIDKNIKNCYTDNEEINNG